MTAPGHHPGSPCRHRDRGAVALYGHDVKHGTAAADHLPASCGTTACVSGFVATLYRLSVRTGSPLCTQRGSPTLAEASIQRAAPVHVPAAVSVAPHDCAKPLRIQTLLSEVSRMPVAPAGLRLTRKTIAEAVELINKRPGQHWLLPAPRGTKAWAHQQSARRAMRGVRR